MSLYAQTRSRANLFSSDGFLKVFNFILVKSVYALNRIAVPVRTFGSLFKSYYRSQSI